MKRDAKRVEARWKRVKISIYFPGKCIAMVKTSLHLFSGQKPCAWIRASSEISFFIVLNDAPQLKAIWKCAKMSFLFYCNVFRNGEIHSTLIFSLDIADF